MSHASDVVPLRRRLAGRLSGVSPLSAVPSWLLSLVLHATLLMLFASGLKSCGGTPDGTEGDFRQVGIYVKPDSLFQESPHDRDETADVPAEATFAAEAAQRPDIEQRPPVELSLPTESVPILGPGLTKPSPLAADIRNLPRPNAIATPAGMPGLGQGETKYYDIIEKGSRFVYVIDISGSMYGGPFQAAKAELIASLQGLDQTQQFQVIFYNHRTHPMVLPRGDAARLNWATDVNKTLSRQYIAGVQADGGTDHMPALRQAMRLNPEVLFFLTDADYPQLSAGDLAEIQRLNQGRARIHAIEYGEGPEKPGDNFMKRLARQNGGSYRYRDVNQFRGR